MTIFFRLLETKPNSNTFAVEPESFQQVPGVTFAYWVSEEIRQLFTEFPPVENEGRIIRVGDHSGDGFQYLRLFWEVPVANFAQDWRSYQKGGIYSPFYCDIHLVANWDVAR